MRCLPLMITICLLACQGRPSQSEPAPDAAPTASADAAADMPQAEPWRYRIRVDRPGTRSERRHGHVSHGLRSVVGEERGQELTTPIGTFRWAGPDDPLSRGFTGWIRISGDDDGDEIDHHPLHDLRQLEINP